MSRKCALTEEQRRAVEWGDGPLMVLAGAGTGKTTVVVGRVRYLLEQDPNLAPENILVLTYNVRAAASIPSRARPCLLHHGSPCISPSPTWPARPRAPTSSSTTSGPARWRSPAASDRATSPPTLTTAAAPGATGAACARAGGERRDATAERVIRGWQGARVVAMNPPAFRQNSSNRLQAGLRTPTVRDREEVVL